MKVTSLRLFARTVALSALVLSSCSDKDEAVGARSDQAGAENEGGADAGEGGKERPPAAGKGGQASLGGSEPVAGTSLSAGTSADAGDGGGAVVAGAAGEGNSLGCERPPASGYYSVQLDLCPRLDKVAQRARDIALGFEKAVYEDCRVRWLTRLYTKPVPQRDEYLNDLLVYNRDLWGCGAPVDQFLLVWESPSLSAGDLAIVVDHYLDVSSEQLQLSEQEQCEMRVALERLGAALVVSAAAEPTQSECVDPGMGGAGGGGAGGGDAGGGAAGTSGGGAGGVSGGAGAAGGGAAGTGGGGGTEALGGTSAQAGSSPGGNGGQAGSGGTQE